MTFFESLLALLAAAILLLQVSRRLRLPYPAMLALAGTLLAFVPGVPTIRIDPATALALFIAPVLLDAAFDFPVGAARHLWRPLAILAVGAVVVTTGVVAWIGVGIVGLPVAAAVALGAIVAPPDAAAATAVLAVVGCAMTLARSPQIARSPRNRVHSFAVWSTVVFLLNVLAFLLMGMQARTIVEQMTPDHLREALMAAGAVVAAVVGVRIVLVVAWNRLAARFPGLRGDLPAPTAGQGAFVAWCGMRGLVTLATAFALPGNFPQRDVVVLTAFGVVLATLVVQGLTLKPLIKLLRLHRIEDAGRDLVEARRALAGAASAALASVEGEAATHVRYAYDIHADEEAGLRFREAGMAAVAAEREQLEALRADWQLDDAGYYRLVEEIDWRELTHLPEEERQIEDG